MFISVKQLFFSIVGVDIKNMHKIIYDKSGNVPEDASGSSAQIFMVVKTIFKKVSSLNLEVNTMALFPIMVIHFGLFSSERTRSNIISTLKYSDTFENLVQPPLKLF